MFSSRDVQAAAGLSSRQQNDWDARGVLPHGRSGEEGWRRFSLRELFVLATCAEMRRRFGVRVERLKWVQDFMLQDGINHLEEVEYAMLRPGDFVWLLSDLEKTFIMSTDPEFESFLGLLSVDAHDGSAFVLLNLTPLVDRVLGRLEDHNVREEHAFETRESYSRPTRSPGRPKEAGVLRMIFDGEAE
jgi:hypothetical protein